jgi:hypothetical protein
MKRLLILLAGAALLICGCQTICSYAPIPGVCTSPTQTPTETPTPAPTVMITSTPSSTPMSPTSTPTP